jgi:lysyl-tRNA synthetase class 2
LRARLLGQIRAFFDARGVLEVETPLLGAAAATDPHLASLTVRPGGGEGRQLYLQTSPEFAMKRLLAGGSGPIYQICKAFRDGEQGRFHNPEFTMLEWYRPGFGLTELMGEVDELLRLLLGTPPARRRSYRRAVEEHGGFDPHTATARQLCRRAEELGLTGVAGLDGDDRTGWRDLLVSQAVEPHLGRGAPEIIFDYPADQAALAQVEEQSGTTVARRFEAYVEGVELANGYQELRDGAEQRRRFRADLEERRRRELPEVAVDERLLAALEAGLPSCSGVSIGIDRLVMLAVKAESLEEVLAFPSERA